MTGLSRHIYFYIDKMHECSVTVCVSESDGEDRTKDIKQHICMLQYRTDGNTKHRGLDDSRRAPNVN
jgi:hypothetical protein